MKPPTADGQPAGAPPVAAELDGAAPPDGRVVVCVVAVVVVVTVIGCVAVATVVVAIVDGVLACVVADSGGNVVALSFEPLEPHAATASATAKPSGSASRGTRRGIVGMLASGSAGLRAAPAAAGRRPTDRNRWHWRRSSGTLASPEQPMGGTLLLLRLKVEEAVKVVRTTRCR